MGGPHSQIETPHNSSLVDLLRGLHSPESDAQLLMAKTSGILDASATLEGARKLVDYAVGRGLQEWDTRTGVLEKHRIDAVAEVTNHPLWSRLEAYLRGYDAGHHDGKSEGDLKK